ncbi:MAG: hypothetical protein R6V23_03395 [Bacteroidales bacterium]
MKAFKKFIIKEAFLTASIGVLALILFQTVLQSFYHPVFWLNLIVVAGLTGILHFSIIRVSDESHSKFSARFMMIAGIKMIAYLMFIVFYALLNPEHAKFFLITFLILYFIYTGFEVFLTIKFFNK